MESTKENKQDKENIIKKAEIINLLHEYNDIKDATQLVLSALANIEQMTAREIHLKYNLPLDS